MTNKQQQEIFFRYQLDILMKEIDLIDKTIGRLDEILLRNRNWRTTLWAGLIAIILQQGNFEKSFILATSILPLLFWVIDVRWKMALLRSSDRQKVITDFLNSPALAEAFETNTISSIGLLDPVGVSLPAGEWNYFVKAIRYKDTPIFYPALVLCNLLLSILI